MTGAWRQGVHDLSMLLNGMKKELSTFGPPVAEETEMTWEAFWRRLPWKMRAALVTFIVAVFSAGVAVGNTTFIRELFKISK